MVLLPQRMLVWERARWNSSPSSLAAWKREYVTREIDPVEGALVTRMFEMARDGLGFKRMAKTLNAEGIPSPSGKSWDKDVTRQVLNRTDYRVLITWGRTKRAYRHATAVKVKGAAQEKDAPHLRIVADELWQAAHARLDATRHAYRRPADGRLTGHPDLVSAYLLSGFTRCSGCGYSLMVKKTSAGTLRYKCSANHTRGKAVCANGASFPVNLADEAVLNSLLDQILDPHVIIQHLDRVIAQVTQELGAPGAQAAERDGLTTAIKQVEQELQNLGTAIALGGEIPTLLASIQARERHKQELQGRLDRVTERAQIPPLDLDALERALQGLFEDWHACFLSPDYRPAARPILKTLLTGRLTFTPDPEGGATFTGQVKLDSVLNASHLPEVSGVIEAWQKGARPPSEASPQASLRRRSRCSTGDHVPRALLSDRLLGPCRINLRQSAGSTGATLQSCQRLVQTGCRFSPKARSPSWASSVAISSYL